MLDFLKIFLAVTFTVVCLASHCYAQELESIELKPAEVNLEVVLKPDIKATKKFTNDKMILTLKNTKPSQNLSLKYNNADVDNVVVKTDKNNTKIIVKSNKIVPPPPKQNSHFWYYLLIALLFSAKLTVFKNKSSEILPAKIYTNKPNYIALHKSAKKSEHKVKIAA